MLLVLTGVTAISVALLAYVNELTKEPIAQANAKTLSDAVSAVVPGFDNDPIAEKKTQEVNGVQYAVYPATKEGKFIGAAVEATSMGFGGELKVLVGFDAEGKIIDYSLLSHVETPGLGSSIILPLFFFVYMEQSVIRLVVVAFISFVSTSIAVYCLGLTPNERCFIKEKVMLRLHKK